MTANGEHGNTAAVMPARRHGQRKPTDMRKLLISVFPRVLMPRVTRYYAHMPARVSLLFYAASRVACCSRSTSRPLICHIAGVQLRQRYASSALPLRHAITPDTLHIAPLARHHSSASRWPPASRIFFCRFVACRPSFCRKRCSAPTPCHASPVFLCPLSDARCRVITHHTEPVYAA